MDWLRFLFYLESAALINSKTHLQAQLLQFELSK